ncbi:MFS transporter [Pectobacterium parmentieri]|uniref:MFS transporter n=1 Tax=Pectobacterium parmentieri TaxID=1905730 RepID=UPI00051A685C|nr:MFS transporter [Pectobacterium parmentieri]AOR60139.1 galactoside permease [Pectobacterium parmentieri]AYH08901.1 MFS transporter [Pectobacterium parmentieri]AYH20335.1 MFS transporter [Pectobacterium parmentieri]AYH35271.1 MFS transporter [Pectobacterium parmentieri]AZS55337.1 MFS transporter [Pectobacterium parmentieri]
MPTTSCYYKNNRNFWIFGAFFFLYFFIMATCFPFLPIWLSDVIGLNKTDTGIVFSFLSLFAILFQPFLGILSDKLGMKKHLLWVISVLLLFFAPFFLYVFAPLLKINVILGALVGGLYIGFSFSAGAGAIEAYIERLSRQHHFEYGKARMFGCFGWGICASTAGMLFNINPDIVFWMGSGSAIILLVLLCLAKTESNPTAAVMNSLGANASPFSLKLALGLLTNRQFWLLVLYVVGVACIYDVYDQQFANFFKSFFSSQEQGNQIFGFVTTAGEAANALVMFCTPWLIGRIGAKNALLVAGTIMSIRILGSACATSITEVIILKMLHAFEVPLLLIGIFKYIANTFDSRLSATIYLVGFQFAKQFMAIFLSSAAGNLYDRIGFNQTYLILGGIALAFTAISAFTLSSSRNTASMRSQAAH